MKRIIFSCLIVCMILSCPGVAVFARDAVIVPPKLIETLEEYQEVQKEYPPVGGITWNKFSMLGEYIPQEAFKNIEDRITYQYGYGERTYYLTINDLSLTFTNLTNGVEPDLERNEYWQQYLPVIDQMTTREFLEVRNAQPNQKPVPSEIVWITPSQSDLVKQQTSLKSYKIACVHNNLVFDYWGNGSLKDIYWIHNGLLYNLFSVDELNSLTNDFGETDVDIVRRLTNLETCEEALNELMSEISDNAVAEMPKGMPRDELTGDDTTDTGENAVGSDENEENKDSKTESVLPWVFLGAAGVLVLATALGILLHSRKNK